MEIEEGWVGVRRKESSTLPYFGEKDVHIRK
jgi:hypothetical protein